jgi:predicted transposase YdaD
MSTQKPYDDAFKELAEHAAEALLQLIDALPAGARVVELLPREVSAQALLPDQPYRIEGAGEPHIAHVEGETRYRFDLLDRVAGYQTRLWLDHQLPVYTYVIILSPAGMPPRAPSRKVIKVGHLTVTARCEIIRLWKVSAKKALALGDENLLPLIPLMDGGSEELRKSAQALRSIPNQVRQRELSLHFVMLGSLRYRKPDIINLLLGGTTMIYSRQVLRETPFYQEILEEGREEGRTEARRALIEMAIRFAERRFGSNTAPVEEINMIQNLEALKQLCLEVDQLPDVNALRQRVLDLAAQESDLPRMD